MLFIMTPGAFENLVRDMSFPAKSRTPRHLQTKSPTGRTSPRLPRQTAASCLTDDTSAREPDLVGLSRE